MRLVVERPRGDVRAHRPSGGRLAVGIVVGALTGALAAGCTASTTSEGTPGAASPGTPSASAGTSRPTGSATTTPPASEPAAPGDDVVGAVVRLTSQDTHVDVTIDQDSPAVRDFLSMLPVTVDVEEFAGREKIATLPRALEYAGTPGSDPEDGDLIYFIPWGNLGFYYDTSGIGYSDQTLHLGVYDATIEQLEALEGTGVTVERLP